MADISKIKLPSGSSYDIKDAWSRQEISSIKDTISGALVFCGETTTEISEGATTSPVTIKTAVKIRGVDYAAGASYTPVAGDVFVYGKVEYAFNGTSWFALGDLNLSADFGALAFKDSATGSATYTPAGSVTGSFTGASMTSTGKYTPQGSVELTAATDASTTVSPAASGDATYTPAGTITGTKFTGTELTSTGSFQPTGTVAIDTSTATHPVS